MPFALVGSAALLAAFFLETTTLMKPLLRSDQIFTTAPLPGVPKMSGEIDTYGITGIPSTVGGRGVVQRAGLTGGTQIVYPVSGREDA